MQAQPETSLFAIAVRWAARISSLASIALLLAFLFGDGGDPSAISPAEWVGLALFPGGVILGMIVGWRLEGWGGVITLASLAAFYAFEFALHGDMPRGPYFLAFALPGLLFGVSWWLRQEPTDLPRPPNAQGSAP